MVAGLHRWLDRDLAGAVAARPQPGPESIARLHALLGSHAPDRVPSRLELLASPDEAAPGLVGRGPGYRIVAVRWPVHRDTHGEGLLCLPDRPVANVIAIPHCEQTPEQLCGLTDGIEPAAQVARRLAECGCRVLVPALLDRSPGGVCNFRGVESVHPKREFVYRAAYEVGRTMIGLELDLVLAAREALGDELPCGVAGYGEGGLLALFAMAVEPRFAAGWVAGYCGPRESLWREPLDRNVFGLLNEFGFAQVAAMAGPRPLVIDSSRHPRQQLADWDETTHHLTPGELAPPHLDDLRAEVAEARGLGGEAIRTTETPDVAFTAFAAALQLTPGQPSVPEPVGSLPDAAARMQRLFEGWLALTQRLVEGAEARREAYWAGLDRSSIESFVRTAEPYRRRFWEELIGAVPEPDRPLHPRTRLRYEDAHVACYDVVLDVFEDVFAYGILVLPRDLGAGDRRPVVVCQHGLEGRAERGALPEDTPAYRKWGYELACRGFVVFSPQNPYLGYDHFRTVQRKANPLGKSLFSFIVRQHQRMLEWLSAQPFVDPQRIAFYGISYGGKTAMRVPALLPQYCLSICSGDYNEWLRKNARIDYPNGYLFTYEYEMPDFDLGGTFNYAEMSWLIFPRPFMVERGHADGCATDAWLAYEWAKTFAAYNLLGIPERAELEWFDGGHTIHGQGTFAFLHKWLDWPAPEG